MTDARLGRLGRESLSTAAPQLKLAGLAREVLINPGGVDLAKIARESLLERGGLQLGGVAREALLEVGPIRYAFLARETLLTAPDPIPSTAKQTAVTVNTG